MNNSFCQIFNLPAYSVIDSKSGDWIVKEKSDSRTKELNIHIDSAIIQHYDESVHTGLFADKSTLIEDKQCDGFAFVVTGGICNRLVFAELKEGFSSSNIQKALTQMCWCFIKIASCLSICKGYDLGSTNIDFVICTQCFEDQGKEDKFKLFIDKYREDPELKILSNIANKLIREGSTKTYFRDIFTICKRVVPLPDSIFDKEIRITHCKSSTYGESVISVSL